MSQKKRSPNSNRIQPVTPWFQRESLYYLLLIAGTFGLYGWTVTFGYSLDDDYVVSYFSNAGNDWSGIVHIFNSWFGYSDYRPVTLLTFWLERRLFGSLQAQTSHLVNVLLYAAVLVALYRFIVAGKFYPDNNRLQLLALLTALIFLAHPNHVSVAANIKSRDNLLSMFFGLIAARQFLLTYDLRQYLRIPVFLLLIILGLLSKRDSYIFILLPALIIVFFREVNLKKAAILGASAIVFYLLAFIIYDAFYALPDKALLQFDMRPSENPLADGGTFAERLSLSITSLGYYLKFLFIPTGYYFYFGYDQIPLAPLFSGQNMLVLLILLILTGSSVYLFRNDRIYGFCLAGFMMSIAYALNYYTPVAGIVMDRYNFIPSTFFCLGAAAIFMSPKAATFHGKQFYAIAALLLMYSTFTVYRTSAWKNHYTLFDRDMKFLTRSANANRLAGGTYIHTALMEELKTGHDKQLTDSFIQKGERYVLRSLDIYDRSPQAWELAGLCDLYRRQDSSALKKFQRSFNADSSYYSSINYIGFTYWNLGQLDSAISYFSYVMDRETYFNYSANNLVNLYLRNNRRKEADSVLQLLYLRFPSDKQLSRKLQDVYGTMVPPSK